MILMEMRSEPVRYATRESHVGSRCRACGSTSCGQGSISGFMTPRVPDISRPHDRRSVRIIHSLFSRSDGGGSGQRPRDFRYKCDPMSLHRALTVVFDGRGLMGSLRTFSSSGPFFSPFPLKSL
ncbi:hypothetical protein Zmor_008139 [Zophobas morio]|uniref:Uncharacterized protein n=1 Tax=Zophobas morio TaxID=2755281 RepID=A0AA38MQE5_9CUCU|nr:hypothetical protein Zmor_008139 [Zophobas morio]